MLTLTLVLVAVALAVVFGLVLSLACRSAAEGDAAGWMSLDGAGKVVCGLFAAVVGAILDATR